MVLPNDKVLPTVQETAFSTLWTLPRTNEVSTGHFVAVFDRRPFESVYVVHQKKKPPERDNIGLDLHFLSRWERKLRSRPRQAGDEQQSPGLLQLDGFESHTLPHKKELHPNGWSSFLVELDMLNPNRGQLRLQPGRLSQYRP